MVCWREVENNSMHFHSFQWGNISNTSVLSDSVVMEQMKLGSLSVFTSVQTQNSALKITRPSDGQILCRFTLLHRSPNEVSTRPMLNSPLEDIPINSQIGNGRPEHRNE